jgi:hypothetical protein
MIVEFYGDEPVKKIRDIKAVEEYIADTLCSYRHGNIADLIGKNLLRTYQEYFKGHYFIKIDFKTCIGKKYREYRLRRIKSYAKIEDSRWESVRKFGTYIHEIPDTGSVIYWIKRGPTSRGV